MLQINPGTRYLFYHKWADARKSFDGLIGLVTNELNIEMESGDVFIFINRSQTHIKFLQWEGDGYGMYYKRLEEGTFELPSGFMEGTHSEISSKQLSLILNGVSLRKAFSRKRYSDSNR
ncbi:IS66 family insertion sequence element accessory protein TnpB [Chitinophaga sancti]|uniref:IS66 Orf2 like protein n=1 Tax=Chitinophaga sancti TaxID=1004 RepID=A0A1K1T2E5_9BACT|nr:IS66 family insertion sequence element accessory protein TnpB [Chitinophaga sancti]WQD59606.1 IS66 family insertion sequence element accessory protein TnpB [Chitinophaga sancti]WQG88261.1 IS66 family insertion sequence element accessory protein TnpB [Chitinophaga sancti]SFW90817.1 IS66 Orf2 like protein [Chitinophaga sancti]